MSVNVLFFPWEWRKGEGGWKNPNNFSGPKNQGKIPLQSVWVAREGNHSTVVSLALALDAVEGKLCMSKVSSSKSNWLSAREQLWRDHLPQTLFQKPEFLPRASRESMINRWGSQQKFHRVVTLTFCMCWRNKFFKRTAALFIISIILFLLTAPSTVLTHCMFPLPASFTQI